MGVEKLHVLMLQSPHHAQLYPSLGGHAGTHCVLPPHAMEALPTLAAMHGNHAQHWLH